jgi:hypothetical protein
LVAVMLSCKEDEKNEEETPLVPALANHSTTPALIKKLTGFESLEVFSLVGSDDVLPESPNYIFGGSADGAGLLKNDDGTFTMVVNHEDNFSVSRLTFDQTFKPVKGEYILNSSGGLWRLCSATLVTPEVHGFGPMFLTCGETNIESRTHALYPFDSPNNKAISRELPALGRWNAENAVPLPVAAYNKTVIIIGDDDSGSAGGQLAMYVASTGNLSNGKVYALRRTDLNQRENDITLNNTYNVEFAEITGAASLTGAQINAEVENLKGIRFSRVEDIDYRKGGGANSREIYFNATGQDANADRTKYGRTYRLKLDATDPLKGTLEVILDGDKTVGNATEFQDPDNICVTENYVYVQEDPNSGYNDQTHDAYIYQYNIATKELKKVIELDHRRTATDADKYNAVPGTGYPQPVAGKSGYGSWEYGAMWDISDIIGIENTFAVCIQPHSWRADKYINPDGGSIRTGENQASQIIIIKGLPR